jgi:glycosyltransferase involved in cell wall biosynthesis
MKKVLLISHIFPPAIDGGSRVIYQFGQHLSKSKCQTLYLSSDCSSTDDFTKKFHYSKDLKSYSSNVLKIPVYHHLRCPLKFINLFIPQKFYLHQLLVVFQKGPIFKFLPFLKTTIQIIKFNPDLIVAGPLPTTVILYAKFFKFISKVLTHQHPKVLINASFHQTDQDFYQQPLTRTLQQSDYLWTLTQYESDFFIEKFNIDPSKIILAGNGVDQSLLKKNRSPKNKVPLFKGKTGLSGKGFTILFIGSFSAHKGVDLLIKSFSTIYKLQPIELILAGQKTLYYPEIIKIIKHQPNEVKKQIKFIFNFPQNQLAQLIDQSDILVLPSSQESFGLVLIESWARGKPVITSDIPPLRELINQSRGGLIFQDKNIQDLSTKLTKLINSPKSCHQLGQNGFNYVKNNYTWSTVVRRICQKISF